MPGAVDVISVLRRIANASAAETFDPLTDSLEALADAIALLSTALGSHGGAGIIGVCSAGMVPSTSVFTCGNLADIYPDDTFTGGWQAIVLRNVDGPELAPEMERSDISNYATAGTFSVGTAFSANVEEGDIILILPNEVAALTGNVGKFTTNSATAPADTRRIGEDENKWRGCLLVPVEGVCRYQPRRIVGFTSATGTFILSVPFPAAPGTPHYVILPGQSLDTEVVATGTFTTSSMTVPADTGRTEGSDFCKGCILMPLTGAAALQPRPIRQFTSGTDVFTLDEPFTVAPGLVPYVILSAAYPVQRLLDIFGVVDAILELTETGGTVVSTGGEDTIYLNNAPSAVYKPLCILLDCSDMAAGDTLVINVYYRILAGGALLLQDTVTLVGVQSPVLKTIELLPNRYGVWVTLTHTGGPNDFDFSVLYEG